MINYTVRRVVASIPVIFGILVVTFVLGRLIPGDPCRAILGEKATKEVCDRFTKQKGLDQPIYIQLGIYMGEVIQGNFGNSIRFHRRVMEIMVERLPMTVELSVTAFIIAVAVGLPAGILAARRHNSLTDVGLMLGANVGVSMPVFWLGLMLAYFFSLTLKGTPLALPPTGRLTAGIESVPFFEVWGWKVQEDTGLFQFLKFFANLYIFNSIITFNLEVLWDAVRHLILPAMALSTIPLSIIARMTRSSLLEVLGLDYVRAARAKGLPQGAVVLKHAFRNALLPVITIMGLQLGGLMAGAVLTESVFGLAGVGRALFEAITSRDYPIVQGFTVVIAVIYVTANLLVDLSYAFLDPRIRLD